MISTVEIGNAHNLLKSNQYKTSNVALFDPDYKYEDLAEKYGLGIPQSKKQQ